MSTETDGSEPADLFPQEMHDINWWNTSEQKLKEGYKIFADNYDKWAVGSEEGHPAGYVAHIKCAEAFNMAATEVHGENKKNLKVLDFGCGTGLVGEHLKRFGFVHLVGLDVSEDMLEKAREKAVFNKLICSYVTNERVHDIESAEFDAVVAAGVFTDAHVKPNAFDEILRWIKPGGIICFTCRSDVHNNKEYGFKETFDSLEKNKRWKLISNRDSDYYGGAPPRGMAAIRAYMLVYRILPLA